MPKSVQTKIAHPKTIQWLPDLETALEKAHSENKFVLLDFFNPTWLGCQKMDAVTYPNEKVIEFFNQYLAPVRVLISSQALPQQYRVDWTPTLIVLDDKGLEHHRTVGYLPPNEVIPSLMLGIAKVHMNHKQYDQALSFLDRTINEFPKSDVAAEAVYFQGVSRFKESHDLRDMREAYNTLQSHYKGSEWVKRASVYESVE